MKKVILAVSILLALFSSANAFEDDYQEVYREIDENIANELANFYCPAVDDVSALMFKNRFRELFRSREKFEEWFWNLKHNINRASLVKTYVMENGSSLDEYQSIKIRLVRSEGTLDVHITLSGIECNGYPQRVQLKKDYDMLELFR